MSSKGADIATVIAQFRSKPADETDTTAADTGDITGYKADNCLQTLLIARHRSTIVDSCQYYTGTVAKSFE